jgi:transposase
MSRVEVISGRERRRHWSKEQKRAIVAEAFAPGASVSAIARRADISTGQIYRWRRDLCSAVAGFTEVMVSPASVLGYEAAISSMMKGHRLAG